MHQSKDATISLEIEYVPLGDTTDGTVSQKQKKTKESSEDKRDDEHEDYVDERESDDDEEEASRKGKEKGSRVPEKKRIRRRLRRQWSDKTKDFQVIKDIFECDNEVFSKEAYKWPITGKKPK